jgi:hypothetical protein
MELADGKLGMEGVAEVLHGMASKQLKMDRVIYELA